MTEKDTPIVTVQLFGPNKIPTKRICRPSTRGSVEKFKKELGKEILSEGN